MEIGRSVAVVCLLAGLGGCASVTSDSQSRDLGLSAGSESQQVLGTAEVVDRLGLRGDFAGEKLALVLEQSVQTREKYKVVRERHRMTKHSRASGAVELEEVRLAARLGLEQEPGIYYLGQVAHPLYKDPQYKLFAGNAAELGREVGVEVSLTRATAPPEEQTLERVQRTEQRPVPRSELELRIGSTSIVTRVKTDDQGRASVDLAPLLQQYARGLTAGGKAWIHPALVVRAAHGGKQLEQKLYPPPSISFRYKKEHQARPLVAFCEELAGKLIEQAAGAQGKLIVLDLSLSSGEVNGLGVAIGGWVAGALQSSSRVAGVVDRATVRKALQEGGFEGTVSRPGARAIGQHLGAAAVVIGRLTAGPRQYEVKLTLFSCATDLDLATVKMVLPQTPYLETLFKQKGS